MKYNKILKRVSAIFLVSLMVLNFCHVPGGEITANAAGSPVKQYYCDHVGSSRGYIRYDVYIQIDANNAGSKEVYVHYSAADEGWKDQEASFVCKSDNGTEIWKAVIGGNGIGEEYVIKYVKNGQIYWDNNNGNNYLTKDILGQANVKAERIPYSSSSSYKIQAVVRNLAYNKVVKVRYTQDNWATYKEKELSFHSSIDETDLERWNTTLSLDADKMDEFQYCISYQVNGQTYWDNNFGENYDRSFIIIW